MDDTKHYPDMIMGPTHSGFNYIMLRFLPAWLKHARGVASSGARLATHPARVGGIYNIGSLRWSVVSHQNKVSQEVSVRNEGMEEGKIRPPWVEASVALAAVLDRWMDIYY